jgi:membrane-associated phospholipid phosphatase
MKLLVALGAFLVFMAVFAYTAKQVYDGDTLSRDTEILLRINNHSSSLFDTLALGITYTGNILAIVLASTITFVWLYRQKRIRSMTQLIFAIGGAIAANALLKLIFQRERPELWQLITSESTYSFPSGHALISAALAITFVLICWRSRFRWLIVTAAVSYTLLVGLSRLYLGVHYPTDVLAGWCFGIAWALIVAVILRVVVVDSDRSLSKTAS